MANLSLLFTSSSENPLVFHKSNHQSRSKHSMLCLSQCVISHPLIGECTTCLNRCLSRKGQALECGEQMVQMTQPYVVSHHTPHMPTYTHTCPHTHTAILKVQRCSPLFSRSHNQCWSYRGTFIGSSYYNAASD